MDYLMCNVVDRVEHMAGTMADWFHFVEQLELEAATPADPYTRFYVTQKVNSPPLLLHLLASSSSPPPPHLLLSSRRLGRRWRTGSCSCGR